jgi:hypothetical protein
MLLVTVKTQLLCRFWLLRSLIYQYIFKINQMSQIQIRLAYLGLLLSLMEAHQLLITRFFRTITTAPRL